MPVFRVEKNKDYTTMCNHHLRDENLTLKAKGLLSLFQTKYRGSIQEKRNHHS